jgi:hypothetical protein
MGIMRNRPGHWLGPVRLLWRTRRARRAGDPGAMVRAVARGAGTAVGGRVRGLRFLLLLDPALAGELLTDHAGDTVKGPGLRRARGLLGDGLLTSEGDAHLRARRLVAPAFSPRRLAGYADGFAGRTAAYVARWRDGDVLDMRREMARLTLDIVGSTLLGIDLQADADSVRDALESALEAFAASAHAMPLGRRGETAVRAAVGGGALRAQVDAVVDKIVEGRRDNPSQDRGDVVSALLAAIGLDHLPGADPASGVRWLARDRRDDRGGEPAAAAPRHAVVSRARTVRSRALAGRAPGEGSAPCLPAVRHRAAIVHRGAVRLGRGDPGAGGHLLPVDRPFRARPAGAVAVPSDAPPRARRADGGSLACHELEKRLWVP